MSEGLSQQDVTQLLSKVASQEVAASRLGATFAGESLTPAERAVAEQVIRTMMDGAALKVRQTLAETLKDSPHLPHDIACALANDVESVAIPVLQFSSVLTDEDLIAIVRSGAAGKQLAVAGRPTVSTLVAGELLGTSNGQAVARLVGNPGASLTEGQLGLAADRFGADPRVTETLKQRPNLPLSVAERVVAFTAETLRAYITKRSDLPESVIAALVLKTRETATVDLRAPHFPAEEAVELVRHLHSVKRLTPSLILRAICVGDLGFVEAAMGQMAGVALHNVRLLMHDAGQLGFKSLYERTGLPPAYFKAFRVALDVLQETSFDGLPYDRERYRRQMIERILTQFEDMRGDDLDYLMIKLESPNPATRAAAAP